MKTLYFYEKLVEAATGFMPERLGKSKIPGIGYFIIQTNPFSLV